MKELGPDTGALSAKCGVDVDIIIRAYLPLLVHGVVDPSHFLPQFIHLPAAGVFWTNSVKNAFEQDRESRRQDQTSGGDEWDFRRKERTGVGLVLPFAVYSCDVEKRALPPTNRAERGDGRAGTGNEPSL